MLVIWVHLVRIARVDNYNSGNWLTLRIFRCWWLDAIYPTFTGGPSAGGFIAGGALLISEGWGIPLAFAQTMLAVMVVLFVGTTMDAGLRLTRHNPRMGKYVSN